MKWDPSNAFATLLISQVALHLIYPIISEAWGINIILGVFDGDPDRAFLVAVQAERLVVFLPEYAGSLLKDDTGSG